MASQNESMQCITLTSGVMFDPSMPFTDPTLRIVFWRPECPEGTVGVREPIISTSFSNALRKSIFANCLLLSGMSGSCDRRI
ncbi:unnamed protein product [Anisakis simplex]|uniref:Uncharacterized protein n=1 Tax=Anisakis simplex TaxID=6269 RepID=A0A0M3JXF6_ANISI|nr:unnamed protein product [Anisakis simplex]